ncbi:hypothetical protein F5Y01DRAFT_305370 [Xylaria sp. FL0043]|nr:hypothetical protein F5Y01DRAFT_305370 [Xylaria sp. FL0043]
MFKQLWLSKTIRTRRKWSLSRKLRRWISNCDKFWTNTWLWEVSSISLSGVCIILIVDILLLYDHRPVPEFTYGITLNAVLSTLTTFSKSFLLVAISGAISQLKWRWFQSTEGRGINDIQLFDDASRGPWALISIIALALEPFTQQLTTYPAREVVDSNPGAKPPTIYRAESYLLDKDGDLVAEDVANDADSFATVRLAFCTSCQNQTKGAQQLQDIMNEEPSALINQKFSLHLPANFPCYKLYDWDLTISATFKKSVSGRYIQATHLSYPHFAEAGGLIFDKGEWQYRKIPLMRFCRIEMETEATFCDFTPCVKKYSFSIFNGIPTVNTISERYGSWYFNTTGLKEPLSLYSNIEPSWIDVEGRNWFILNENGTHPYTNLSSRSFSFNLSIMNTKAFSTAYYYYTGQVSFWEEFTDDERNHISNNTGIQFNRKFWTSFGKSNAGGPQNVLLSRIITRGGLRWAAPRMAAAASRYLRDKDAIPIEGHAYRSIIIVGVQWPWLALPVTTWVCGVMFLALTMWVCRGSEWVLWKTSSLPFIYHGFKDKDVATFKTSSRLERVSEMEKYSENLYARIRRDSNDGQLRLMRTFPAIQP